ncbi:MAG: ATP-binding protein [Rickettsiales bacterium]
MLQLRITHCTWHDLDAVYKLAEALAHYFPKPEAATTGIYELLVNAIEHGTLGLGFETKTQLLRSGRWYEEIRARLHAPETSGKSILVSLERSENACELRITDEGSGFAWQEFSEHKQSPERPNGRGLWIAFHSSFDEVVFNATGNEVTCRAHSSSTASAIQSTPLRARA